jgi:serine/threonine protein kinase
MMSLGFKSRCTAPLRCAFSNPSQISAPILNTCGSGNGPLRKRSASLSHPHICHHYDVGQQDGTSYLVMEYLEGETLANGLCFPVKALPGFGALGEM